MNVQPQLQADPITRELIRNYLSSVADELADGVVEPLARRIGNALDEAASLGEVYVKALGTRPDHVDTLNQEVV